MKVLFLIISLLINLAVCNNGSNLENLKNETEEYVDYAPEDNLSFSVIENAVEERYYYNEPLILHIEITKANNSITNVSILPTIIYGNVNYSIGTNVIYFNEDESSFTLQINHVTQGNSHMRLELTPSTNDNNSISLDKTYINIYFVGELNFYCFSTLSITRARQIACHFLVFDGIIEDELGPIDEYIYQEPNAYYFTSTTINEEKNIIDGLFNFQSEDLNYYPADGVKVGLYAYDTNDNIVYFDETYIDEVGYFSLNLETTSYSKLSLIFFAETKYVRFCESYTTEKIGDKTYYYFNNPYEYEINLTDNVNKTLGKKYTINNLYTNFDNDRGQAFGNAVLMNAGGKFYENMLGNNIEQINVVQPGDGYYSISGNYISLPDYGQEGALHEYGHYVHKSLELIRPYNGFKHYGTEDLALRYPDMLISGKYEKGRGYYAAWAEGFATFYSNLVQNYYDYSHLSETWKDEYVEFQNLNTNNVNFVLRESNEKTVTNVLLALCDPQFRYDDAIGIKTFFDLLVENKDDVASLSDALNIVKENIEDSLDVINEVTSYYKIAPNSLHVTIPSSENIGENVEKTKNSVFTESDIPTFKWDVGNYAFETEYIMRDKYGNGDLYTEEQIEEDSSRIKYNYGLSNNDFTLYIYNSNGEELFKKEHIQYQINSSKIVSYTPTNEEWKSVFYSSSFFCYWMVEGTDLNHTYVGKIKESNYTSDYDITTGYVYQSEPFPFVLEKKYQEIDAQTNYENYDIENLELEVELSQTLPTNDILKRYEINVNYTWDENNLPDVRLKDYIVLRWNYIYNLDGIFYAVNYYDDDTIYTSDSSYSGQTFNYGSTYRELYYEADLMYNKKDAPVSKLYGEATIGIETTQNYDSLFISVTYYHIMNTATAMEGIQQNNYGYDVNTTEIEKIDVTYQF